MLNTIKSMIKEKESFLEAADVIFEDGSGNNLDDLIILGEEGEPTVPETDINESDDDESKDSENDADGKNDEGEDDDKGHSEDDDVSNLPITDEPASSQTSASDGSTDDILDSPTDGSDIGSEQPMPLPGNDLPTPVGAQTGEPINDDNDIMNVEIDLGSNTVKDVLPVPPANAGEAIADHEGSQHVDSGFGGENNDPTADPSTVVTPGTEETDLEDPMIESVSKEFQNVCKDLQAKLLSGVQTTLKEHKKLGSVDSLCKYVISALKDKKTQTINNSPEKFDTFGKDRYIIAVTGQIDFGNDAIQNADGSKENNFPRLIEKVMSSVVTSINKDLKDKKYKLEVDDEHGNSVWLNIPIKSYDAEFGGKAMVEQASVIVDPIDSFMNGYGLYSEAITLGDDPAPAAEGEASKEDASPATEDPAAGGDAAEESEVTSAVRDKVAEVESDAPTSDGGDTASKDELLKKLGNITKSLEDAKKAVMNTLQ